MDANESVASSATEPLTDTTSTDAGALATSQTEQAPGLPAESSTAQESDDKDVPFHEHPRWQKVIAENRELREKAALAESLAPFQPLVEQFREKGFESFDAVEQARLQYEQTATIEQQIAESLDAYRQELEQDGHDDPQLIDRLLTGKQAELVAEASEQIAMAHQHAQAVEAAKAALPNASPELLEVVKLFDAPSIPVVTQHLQSYIESRVTSEVEAKVAEWEKTRAAQMQTAVPLKGSGGAENAAPPRTLNEIRAMSWRSVIKPSA